MLLRPDKDYPHVCPVCGNAISIDDCYLYEMFKVTGLGDDKYTGFTIEVMSPECHRCKAKRCFAKTIAWVASILTGTFGVFILFGYTFGFCILQPLINVLLGMLVIWFAIYLYALLAPQPLSEIDGPVVNALAENGFYYDTKLKEYPHIEPMTTADILRVIAPICMDYSYEMIIKDPISEEKVITAERLCHMAALRDICIDATNPDEAVSDDTGLADLGDLDLGDLDLGDLDLDLDLDLDIDVVGDADIDVDFDFDFD